MEHPDELWVNAMVAIEAGKREEIAKSVDDQETRIRSLEKYQMEQVGITKGQAIIWTVALIVLSALVSIGIKMILEGVFT